MSSVPHRRSRNFVLPIAVATATILLTACGAAPRLGDELAVVQQTASVAGTSCSAPQLTISINGSVATLTANATCGSGAEYRFLVAEPGGPYTEVAPYSTSNTVTVDTTNFAPGRYGVLVVVRSIGSAAAYDAYADDSFRIGNVCSGATLAATRGPNGTLDLAATATCPSGTSAEYKFLVRAPGTAAWAELRGWGSSTFAWDTSALTVPGRYEVLVYARVAGNLSAYEAYASAGTAVGVVCTAATLTASANGSMRNLTATASCGGSTPEYKFLVRAPGASTWAELRGWGSPTFAWDTSALTIPGRYDLFVYARVVGNLSAYEAYASTGTAVGGVCTGATLTVSADASMRNLVASATCGDSTPEYKFLVRAPGGTAWAELRGWGSSTFAWDTSALTIPGRYDLFVYARATGNLSIYEAYASASANVGGVCTGATLTATTDGSMRNLTASAACDGSTPEYKFFVRAPGGTAWSELRGWGSSTFAWDTSALTASGRYDLLVYARAAGNLSAYEAYASTGSNVGETCTAAALAATAAAGASSVSLTATATCGAATPEFRFLVRAPGAASYADLRGWGPQDLVWDSSGQAPGTYAFLVYARIAGNASIYEAYATKTFTLQ